MFWTSSERDGARLRGAGRDNEAIAGSFGACLAVSGVDWTLSCKMISLDSKSGVGVASLMFPADISVDAAAAAAELRLMDSIVDVSCPEQSSSSPSLAWPGLSCGPLSVAVRAD